MAVICRSCGEESWVEGSEVFLARWVDRCEACDEGDDGDNDD